MAIHEAFLCRNFLFLLSLGKAQEQFLGCVPPNRGPSTKDVWKHLEAEGEESILHIDVPHRFVYV